MSESEADRRSVERLLVMQRLLEDVDADTKALNRILDTMDEKKRRVEELADYYSRHWDQDREVGLPGDGVSITGEDTIFEVLSDREREMRRLLHTASEWFVREVPARAMAIDVEYDDEI